VSRFPALNGKQVIRVLERLGFHLERISSSSHHILAKENHPTVVCVPVHGNHVLPQTTFRSILRQAGLKPGEFFRAYWKL